MSVLPLGTERLEGASTWGDSGYDKLVSLTARLWLQAKTASESVSSLSGATRSCFSAMFLMR